jgi:glycine amidinotransferase
VSSWNEWDPLQEVVVGIADGSAVPPLHPAEEAKVFHLPNTKNNVGMRDPEKIKRANAQLDGFAEILRDHGVEVRRPRYDPNVGFRTPHFESKTQNGATCPRDIITVIGNEIIEAPTPWRSRNFEFSAYRDLLVEYFREDKDMIWTPAPFPALRDDLFRENYSDQASMRAEQVARREFVTHDWVEPTFDAADIIRCGKDVFVLHSHTCNLAGFEWIKRQLSRRGIRAHLMQTPSVLNTSHYDASIMPLRSDLLLVSPLCVNDVDIFRENGWHVEVCAEPEIDQAGNDPNYHGKSGKWICMNVLPLGPEKVAVMEHDKAVTRQLESLDFEVVHVPFKDVVEFGGALHCCTMDIRRSGNCESYFPNLE